MPVLGNILHVVVASGLALTLTCWLVAAPLEFIRPVQAVPVAAKARTIWFASFATIAAHFGRAILAAAAVALANVAGGGLITLPGTGPWLLASIAIFVLTADCLRYWRHRLEHSVPVLWMLHSFHHSDRSLSVFSGLYTYWLSKVVQALIELPILGLLFRVTPGALVAWVVLQVIVGISMHLNVRLGWGPLTLVMVGPQFHRIHHSLEPQHRDHNFAHAFPVWDVIFGTAWKPARDEWPATGLEDEPPARIVEAMTWPARFGKGRSALRLR